MATNTATASSVKRWFNVPNGSTLTIRTSANPPNVRITIVMLQDDGSVTRFNTNQVLNKTVTIPLVAPRLYTLAVTMEFAGAATTLTFLARVTKPDGTQHGGKFEFEASRPPAAQFAQISVFTVGA